jgi:putative PIN family toxin of toxin-antitoxin system
MRRFVPLCSSETTEELLRALTYPKFKLGEVEIRVLVDSYIRFAEVVQVGGDALDELPRCRDPDDQMFLELAWCGDADVLVTGDDDLLELADECDFAIETPAEFKKRFED